MRRLSRWEVQRTEIEDYDVAEDDDRWTRVNSLLDGNVFYCTNSTFVISRSIKPRSSTVPIHLRYTGCVATVAVLYINNPSIFLRLWNVLTRIPTGLYADEPVIGKSHMKSLSLL